MRVEFIRNNRARSLRVAAFGAVAASMLFGATSGFALTIVPSFSGLSSAAEADVNSAISLYEATFTDNITVHIGFSNMGSGLGESNTAYGQVTYGSYITQLMGNAHGGDDAKALAQLAANPLSSTAPVWVSEANLKALGYDTSGFTGDDGDIGLNAGICFTDHNNPVAGEYDLFAVACHEMDEVLGTVSGVGDSDGVLTDADLFRYDGSGNRSFTTDTSQHAYFSIDGTNLLDEYNQYQHAPGDWGDWKFQEPQQVQDYALAPGESVNPNVEFRLLDVEGFTRLAPVPEPATMTVLGMGVLALLRRRRRS